MQTRWSVKSYATNEPLIGIVCEPIYVSNYVVMWHILLCHLDC